MSGVQSAVEPAAILEIRGAVALITLNRPEALNAFDQQMADDLREALLQVATDAEVRVVVLTGAGKAFSAGADLKTGLPDDRRIEDVINTRFRPPISLIRSMDKPVIAAVRGPAAGIGLSFALACDLVVMSENAYILSPFAAIGLIPDGGATWFLASRMGYHRAYEACIEGDRIDAPRCLELGLANRVVPGERLLGEAMEWAESLARKAPLSLALTKRAMRRSMDVGFDDAFSYEAQNQNTCQSSADAREGIAAFVEKRAPDFKGR
jgi:2-(1,2-epoxy-1,2-dihydrophenyl)acetyl-CoA isomerase